MRSLIKRGKTIDEAVESALRELNGSREDAIIEVLEEPKTGLFGLLGSKEATVRVSLKEPEDNVEEPIEKEEEVLYQEVEETEVFEKEEEIVSSEKEISNISQEEAIEKAGSFLKEVLDKMHIEADVRIEERDAQIYISIVDISDEDTGIVIGKRGETLDALQYLVNLVFNRKGEEYKRVIIDANNYRRRREESLEKLAYKTAKKAKKYRRSMRLEPMNPYERRIVHSALQDFEGITTSSEGEEPYRCVVVRLQR